MYCIFSPVHIDINRCTLPSSRSLLASSSCFRFFLWALVNLRPFWDDLHSKTLHISVWWVSSLLQYVMEEKGIKVLVCAGSEVYSMSDDSMSDDSMSRGSPEHLANFHLWSSATSYYTQNSDIIWKLGLHWFQWCATHFFTDTSPLMYSQNIVVINQNSNTTIKSNKSRLTFDFLGGISTPIKCSWFIIHYLWLISVNCCSTKRRLILRGMPGS